MDEILTIGERIKFLREKLDINRCRLANIVDIPEVVLRNIEKGSKTTKFEELRNMARLFHHLCTVKKLYPFTVNGQEVDYISLNWLLFGEDRERQRLKNMLKIIEEDFRERELQLVYRNLELDMKLTGIDINEDNSDN